MLRPMLSCVLILLTFATAVLSTDSDTTRCYTFYGSKSHSTVSTQWQTHFTRCTVTQTVTSVVSTRAPGSTITSTVTTVSTVSSGTSTIGTSSGFLPVRSTYPGSTYDGASGGSPAGKREAAFDLVARNPVFENQSFKASLNPKSVGCNLWTRGRCRTKTTTVTSTTLLPATISPVVVTQTVNATTTVPSATVYAACPSNNFAYVHNVQQVVGEDNSNFVGFDTSQPYDCCVAALNVPTETGIATTWGLEVASGGGCFILYTGSYPNGGSCPDGQSDNQYAAETNPVDLLFVGGNANCGEIIPPIS